MKKSPNSAVEPRLSSLSSEAAGDSRQSPEGEPTKGSWRSKLANLPPRGSRPGPGLHVISTPIGHSGDITLRALDTLEAADLVACEDTRVTARLLGLYGIKAKLIAYHDHNGPRVRPKLMEALESGAVVALVSDAGTPMVSDPGYRLVCEARESGIAVHAVPGASSILAALAGAGLPTDRFMFAGFLPQKDGPRRAALQELAGVPASLIFFESGPRLAASLKAMAAVLGNRPAAVARELTKTYEETRRGDLADLAVQYDGTSPPKGEIVVVVGPPEEGAEPELDLDALLRAAMADGPLKSAVDKVAAETGLPRRQVYQRALVLKDEAP